MLQNFTHACLADISNTRTVFKCHSNYGINWSSIKVMAGIMSHTKTGHILPFEYRTCPFFRSQLYSNFGCKTQISTSIRYLWCKTVVIESISWASLVTYKTSDSQSHLCIKSCFKLQKLINLLHISWSGCNLKEVGKHSVVYFSTRKQVQYTMFAAWNIAIDTYLTLCFAARYAQTDLQLSFCLTLII